MDWSSIFQNVLVGLLGGGVGAALVTAIANRPKTRAEAHLNHAQAENTEAEAEQKRVAVYQGLIQNLHTELNGVHSEVTALKNQQAANMKHITELQSKDVQWQKRCDEMQVKISALESERKTLEHNGQNFQAQLTTLQSERQELKDGIQLLINQLEKDLNMKAVWKPKPTAPLKQ